jgi:hypothetical protein
VFDDIQGKLHAHAEAGFTTFDTADIYGPSEGGRIASTLTHAHVCSHMHMHMHMHMHHQERCVFSRPPTADTAADTAADTTHCHRVAILGEFAQAWREAGNTPVTLLTKYVPNIFQAPPTPAAVEAAVQRSITNLRVRGSTLI